MHLVELEKQIKGDTDGTVRDSHLNLLEKARKQLDARAAAGLHVNEFETFQALSEALKAATAVLRFSWAQRHQPKTGKLS